MKYHDYVLEVYRRISPYIRKTPLLNSLYFTQKTGSTIFLKCENLQYTNAFKVRGAFSKITSMPNKNKIIITASAGNHGLAIAYAAKKFGMKALVVVPNFVPQFRIDKIKKMGADVIVDGASIDELNAKVTEYTKGPSYIYIHGFDDDDIIAGQATIAYEILQDVPDIDVILVPVGGGGLISGIAKYAKSFNKNIIIYGAQPTGANAMSESLAANKLVTIPKVTSIAISLSATRVGEKTFEIVKETVEKVVTITDEEIIHELKEILDHDKLLVEPASACPLAAIVANKIPDIKNKKVAVILSGGNFSLEQLKTYL
jgi:threonine dehydratase